MGRDSLTELAEAIRAHARFDEAARRLIDQVVAWRTQLGVLNKLVSSVGRERIFEHLLFLHYARDLDNTHGATFERLAALSESRDDFGARALRTALRLAQIGGMVAMARSRRDGRLRIFEPTEQLLSVARDHYAINFGVLDAILPDASPAARIRSDPTFLPAMLARAGQTYLAHSQPIPKGSEPFLDLLRLEGGRSILANVIKCHWSGEELPATQELSLRFHVSQSQIRVILKSAERLGLIRTVGRGRVADAAALAEQYVQIHCRYLAFFAAHGLQLDGLLLARGA